MAGKTFSIKETRLYFLPVETRIPLKFGPEITTSVTVARVSVRIEDQSGATATGWGETPLSVQWVWPSMEPYEPRHQALKDFVIRLARGLADSGKATHPVELGRRLQAGLLTEQWNAFRSEAEGVAGSGSEAVAAGMPWLAALVSLSPFDIAIHDAYARLLGRPVYGIYGSDLMDRDLSAYLEPAESSDVSFSGVYPEPFLVRNPPRKMRAWHLVGGKDLLDASELTGSEPEDGYPVLLPDWIERDGLKCLKIKLTGSDSEWDYDRLVRVGRIAEEHGVEWLTADFNCTVKDPAYVVSTLDRLVHEHPRIYGMILYVEQPFPYELEENRIDVHAVSARKPLFMDESAHDWTLIRLGRSLGWSGVALKTCKTQTGALLSLCWAKAHGMTLMVQDLTNPMLAQIPHVQLAAHAGTIMGVETNAMQFYPEASNAEAKVHPGLYSRRDGLVDLSTLGAVGFGYREEEIARPLPDPVVS